MPAIKLNVYGRTILVEQSEHGWSVFYLGHEGKRRPATDIVVPHAMAAADIPQYLADLCHEWASVRHSEVKRLL